MTSPPLNTPGRIEALPPTPPSRGAPAPDEMGTKEEAEAANRAQNVFFASAGHELRTPLNAILGYTQLLLGGALPAEQREPIQTIHQAAERLLLLINDLVEIARDEVAPVAPAGERVPLADLLAEVLAKVRPQAEAKALYFQCTREAGLPPCVRADPRRLRQVLLQLLDHALRATEAGSVCLDLSVRAGQVRFLILNTGGRLLPEIGPNRGAPPPSRGAAKGAGFAFALSQKLLHLMGSRLCPQAEPGDGTALWFELPAEAEVPPATASELRGAGQPAAAPPGTGAELPPEAIRELQGLVGRGDVLGLRQALEALQARSVGSAQGGVAQLLQFTVECKLRAVRELLNAYERDHPHR